MNRTLVIAPQWIGDAVMAEPLLAALAAGGATLTVAALPWVAPVFRAMPQVGETLELPFAHGRLDWSTRRGIGATLRDRFDAAYVLPNSIKSALLPWLARIPLRVGYQGEGRVLLLNRRLPNPAGRPPMVAFYGALAGPGFDATARPSLHLDEDHVAAALSRAALTRGRYWAFAPGAEYGPAKRWPPAHYAALARSLRADDGTTVVLLGSPGEAALCESIGAAAPGACVSLAGRTPLLDAIALIAASRGLASNDSGLMHVAAAFGVPQVALFGSTSPVHTPPLNARARVLWLKGELQRDCIPCFERTCRFDDTACLAGITAARAEAALRDASTEETALSPAGGERADGAGSGQSENLPA